MLTEKLLEAKIIEQIASVIPATAPAHLVTGFWQPTAVGTLKGLESDSSSVALVEVSTALGVQPTFSEPTVTFSVSVQLTIRLDLDANGNHLLTFAEPLAELFKTWMSATYQQSFATLDVVGLSIDGIGVTGSAPVIDAASMIARVRWDLNLSGCYAPPTPNPEN